MHHHEIQTDFHLHTTESDGKNSMYRMLRKAQKVGLDYIAITDHNRSTHMEPLWAQERYGVSLIDGFELTTLGEHVGVLGVNHHVANRKLESWGLLPHLYYQQVSHRKLEDIFKWARDEGAATIMFHPGFPWPGSASLKYTKQLFDKGLIDGAESKNDDIEWRMKEFRGGGAMHKLLQRGIQGFLKENNIPAFKHSDAHSHEHLGTYSNTTQVNYNFRPDRVVADIRNRNFLK